MPASEHQSLTRQELREELAALKAEILGAIARFADPVALACQFAEVDPTPIDSDTMAELDAALADDTPGVPIDQVRQQLAL